MAEHSKQYTAFTVRTPIIPMESDASHQISQLNADLFERFQNKCFFLTLSKESKGNRLNCSFKNFARAQAMSSCFRSLLVASFK